MHFLMFAVGIGLVTSDVPSASEYQRAKEAITELIGDTEYLPRAVRLGKIYFILDKNHHEFKYFHGSNNNWLYYYYLSILAFHDCIGPNGCDGCVNDDDPDNAGLQGIKNRLGNLRQNDGFTVELT